MKLSLLQALLAVLFTGGALAHDATAQDVLNRTLSVRFENEGLRNVLREIERRAQVRFAFRPREIPFEQKISLSASNEPLGAVLEKLTRPLRLRYEVLGQQIIIGPTPPAPTSPPNNWFRGKSPATTGRPWRA